MSETPITDALAKRMTKEEGPCVPRWGLAFQKSCGELEAKLAAADVNKIQMQTELDHCREVAGKVEDIDRENADLKAKLAAAEETAARRRDALTQARRVCDERYERIVALKQQLFLSRSNRNDVDPTAIDAEKG